MAKIAKVVINENRARVESCKRLSLIEITWYGLCSHRGKIRTLGKFFARTKWDHGTEYCFGRLGILIYDLETVKPAYK